MEGEAKIAYRQGAVLKSLRHGNFLPWIKVEFGMSHATALNFINVAQTFGDKSLTVRNLRPKTLYLLAAPSMPERGEALSRDDGRKKGRKAEDTAADQPTASLRDIPLGRLQFGFCAGFFGARDQIASPNCAGGYGEIKYKEKP